MVCICSEDNARFGCRHVFVPIPIPRKQRLGVVTNGKQMNAQKTKQNKSTDIAMHHFCG